jgi:hypothetical protein
MTTTVTVEVDEDELTAAAELLGTSSREETVRRLVANAAARAANVARKRADMAWMPRSGSSSCMTGAFMSYGRAGCRGVRDG